MIETPSLLVILARVVMLMLGLGFSTDAQTVARAPSSNCAQFYPGGEMPVLTNPRLTPQTTLLCNDGYAVLASGVTHGAIWSAEHPTAASVAAAREIVRESAFFPEPRLPPADQAQLQDYSRSGYDHGQMTPSGDMPGWQAQQQSFSLANMVPQTPQLNRGSWERIETAVRDLALRQGELYVVTGPAFQGQQLRSIGPNGVLVPSATWKAVYDPQTGTGVYVCTNTAKPRCSIISVAALTDMVGVDPFPALPASMKAIVITLPITEANRQGMRQRSPRRPETTLGPGSVP